MGFDDGRIVFDSPNGAYYSGQTIRGNLIFQQDTVKTFRGIFLQFRGYCKVHWTTIESRRVYNSKTVYQTNHHKSYEEYVNTQVYLVGSESGEHTLQPGNYDYPFTFQLPAHCPSSFEGAHGHVRYKIKAVMVNKALKLNQKKKVVLRVMAPLDLNLDPICREPIEMDIKANYYSCCFSSGSTDTVIKAPRSGYCSGQTIPIEISCTNKGSVKIDHIKVRIKKKVIFIATQNPAKRSENDIVTEIKGDSIAGNTTLNRTVEMEVPALDVYNLSGCSFIELHYKLEVIVSPSGFHSNSDNSRKIIIGTIPLVDLQNNAIDSIHHQIQQQIGAVTQQPTLSHPVTNYPLPGGNNDNYYPYPTNSISKLPYPVPNPPFLRNPGNVINPYYPSQDIPYPDDPPPYSENDNPTTNVTSDQITPSDGVKTSDMELTNTGSRDVPITGTTPEPVKNDVADGANALALDSPHAEKIER